MVIHPFIFILDIITLLLFILTLNIQIKNQVHYKNSNGLRYHRLAYIGITFSLTLNLIFRIIAQLLDYQGDYKGYFVLETKPFWSIVILSALKIFMFVVAIFSYLWFKGSNFKFLKIFDKFL